MLGISVGRKGGRPQAPVVTPKGVTQYPISIDTYKSSVAKAALGAGAHIINDIWGLQDDSGIDSGMAEFIAAYDVPVIIMHNHVTTQYQTDVMADICSFLRRSIEIALNAGINFDNIIVDPGIGFGKNGQQNLLVMSRLEELKSLGCPILLGTSRKRFIGDVLNLPVDDRIEGTAATVALGITKGVNFVRVHDVEQIARIAKMTDAMMRGDYYG
ncbi:MAG: dihydropteroate synthase [Negativicutes bacterium]|nr:dihydropteroate synthase [Negativicutes bacterium]